MLVLQTLYTLHLSIQTHSFVFNSAKRSAPAFRELDAILLINAD